VTRSISNRWKGFALLFPIVGMAAATALAQGPGGQRGFFQAWYGVLSAAAPSDYLHFWNPASLDETDQGPGGNDATSLNFAPDSNDGWNMGTDNNKYVLLDGPITNGTSYTITAWIKPDITAMNANTIGGSIVNERTSSGSTRDFQLFYGSPLTYGSELYRATIFNSAGTIESDNNTNFTDNVWQHVALVVNSDAGTIEVFVDGVSDGSNALTITPNDSYAGNAAIGGYSPNPSLPDFKYHGSIGKVRIYQRALTALEIQREIQADGNTGP
jgi:hypothetical protein